MRTTISVFRPTLGGAVLCFTLVGAAVAQDASQWDGDARAAVRLIGAARMNVDTMRAGLQIKLGPGWKTYWRYPGDSGVPPRFDFSRSENLGELSVLWPAPHRFTDDGGTSIGY